MARVKMNKGNKEFKPTPDLDLRGEVGMRVLGKFKGRIESKLFPGKFTTILSVIETNGSTTLWDKEAKIDREVDIEVGDDVYLREGRVLEAEMVKLEKDDIVEIIYTGKGEAKPGRKAPYLYDVFKHVEEA